MSDQNEALEEVLPDIQRAAAHIALEWPDVVQEDDIAQEIALRLLADTYAITVAKLEPAPRRRVLYRIAQQLAAGERVSYEFFSGNYRYSTGEVREHLEKGVLFELTDEELGGGKVQFCVEQVDIRQAYLKIAPHHRAVLTSKFTHGEYGGYSINVTRAVDALTAELNRSYRRAFSEYEGPGSRKALSNSAAAWIIRNFETRA